MRSEIQPEVMRAQKREIQISRGTYLLKFCLPRDNISEKSEGN
jgi:hypothetical protein